MDDSRIIDLFFERSEQAITELSDKYGSVCRRIAENILNNGSDSEECVNDAYLAVWNNVPPAKPDPLSGYLYRIVRNLALKKYHSNTAQKRDSRYDVALDEIIECFPSATSAEDEAEASEVSKTIDCFLETLDEQSRVMFVRRYFYSDSLEDLSGMFHRSRHYVSVRLSRIREALRKHLTKNGVQI